MKCEFKLVFNDYEYCAYITSQLFDNKTMCFWQTFLVDANKDFKNKGYDFHQIAEINIITLANKMDRSCDFFIRHIIHAVERKLNAMINKNENLTNKVNWKLSLVRKINHIPILNMSNYLETFKLFLPYL